MTDKETKEWQEAARRAKVKADQEKEKLSPPGVAAVEHLLDSVKLKAPENVDKKKEAQRKWREKNRERLAAEERARRAEPKAEDGRRAALKKKA